MVPAFYYSQVLFFFYALHIRKISYISCIVQDARDGNKTQIRCVLGRLKISEAKEWENLERRG